MWHGIIEHVRRAASSLNDAQLCILLASLVAAVRFLRRERSRRRRQRPHLPPFDPGQN